MFFWILRNLMRQTGSSVIRRNWTYATFAMMESDYDVFAQLDLREYKQIFTAFTAYQDARADMERKNYDVCAYRV